MSKSTRGSVAIEVAILIPVLILVVAAAAAGWRLWWTQTQVEATAQAAARAASLATSVRQAEIAVEAIIGSDLGRLCQKQTITKDLTAVGFTAGVAGTVRVEITCGVNLADLLLPLPGSIDVRGSATEAVDIFRKKGQ